MRTKNSYLTRWKSKSPSKSPLLNPIEQPRSEIRTKKRKIEISSEPESEFPGSDFISSLPDSILCQIISFLDTKSAVRTSLIAKRYKTLWTQLENLHLHSEKFSNFESQVSALLQRREYHINLTSLRLSLYYRANEQFLVNCVDYAVSHNLQHFRIRAHMREDIALVPKSLVNSSTLVSLRLSNAIRGSLQLPLEVNMVSLKELYLKKFEFSSESYDGGLFRGCPNLESLVLHKCWIKPSDKLKVLDVNCPKLANLEIKHWRGPWLNFDECLIEVNAPKLVSFKFQGFMFRLVFKERFSCLESLYFDLGYPTSCAADIVKERMQRTLECFVTMLGWLCNAKFMSLSWKTYEVLRKDPDLRLHSPITFANLRSIKFTAERVYTEIRMSVQSVKRSLEESSDGIFHFNLPKKKGVTDGVPANVLHYFLENSPSAESFYMEIEKKSIR